MISSALAGCNLFAFEQGFELRGRNAQRSAVDFDGGNLAPTSGFVCCVLLDAEDNSGLDNCEDWTLK